MILSLNPINLKCLSWLIPKLVQYLLNNLKGVLMDKRFLVVLGIVILGLIGLFVFTKDKAQAPSSTNTNTSVSASNHIEGNKNSKVKLLVYGDFQCSACEQFYPTEKKVVEKYSSQISFQFRHFPLDNLHPNARAASRAAEAAGLQGKFFEMHNMLYENQSSWINQSDPLVVFESMARALKLDTNKFKTDFSSEAVNNTINADYRAGSDAGVNGTPTYFINGKKINNEDLYSNGAPDAQKFSNIIETALKSNGQ